MHSINQLPLAEGCSTALA